MILFADDFHLENAGVHDTTNNKSFIKISKIYKDMGISNRHFPLALYQKELAPYDPHNLTDPSVELRSLIALECKINPWYFVREVLRIPATGGTPIPMNANRAAIAMLWCFFNNVSYIAIQPRQTGKTVIACAAVTWTLYIGGKELSISLYTHESRLVHENVARIKIMRDALPDYIVDKRVKDTDNKEGLSYTKLGTKYRTTIARDDKQGADSIGRGMTDPFIHMDEPGFCNNIKITYSLMQFATLAAIENAKKNGQPHANILTTTAAPIDTERGRFTFDLVNKAMPFDEKLYDLNNNAELKQTVRANSTNDMINGTFSYLMLGKTREWYQNAVRIGGATKDVNDRELLNMWISGTETSVLSFETIRILNANRREAYDKEIIQGYVVSWYITQDFRKSVAFGKRQYILGMDSSDNIGLDFTTLVMIDVADMAVVCTFRCNDSNTTKIALFIAEFLIRYSNVTFIPESKSTGRMIIDTITLVFSSHGINPFRRIYNEIVQKRDDPLMARININDPSILDTESVKKHLGFMTSAQTRPYLYKNTLAKAADMNASRVYDATLVSELSALSTKNGRIDHKDGGHDDMIVAYLLACWLIFFGQNLGYYGIDVRSILTSVTSDGEAVDPAHREAQLGLRRDIKHYEDILSTTESPILKNTYRQNILLLQDRLDRSITVEPIGVAKVTQDVKDYGKTLYTPQEFARKEQTHTTIDPSLFRRMFKLM